MPTPRFTVCRNCLCWIELDPDTVAPRPAVAEDENGDYRTAECWRHAPRPFPAIIPVDDYATMMPTRGAVDGCFEGIPRPKARKDA